MTATTIGTPSTTRPKCAVHKTLRNYKDKKKGVMIEECYADISVGGCKARCGISQYLQFKYFGKTVKGKTACVCVTMARTGRKPIEVCNLSELHMPAANCEGGCDFNSWKERHGECGREPGE